MQFQSEGLHCYPDDAKQFPIAKASKEQQQPIIALVDQILDAKKSNPSADISALEREIDRLVYGLYRLTEEEIKVVEGGGHMPALFADISIVDIRWCCTRDFVSITNNYCDIWRFGELLFFT